MDNVYFLGLTSNFSFALGSIIFAIYSRRISSSWMNYVKTIIGGLGFFLTVSIFSEWHAIELSNIFIFLISGIIGLGIGDILLLKAFSELGPGRTLMLFGFQPLFIGALSYYFLDQGIDYQKLWAIIFFILCLFTFSFEGFKKNRSWQLKGILMALGGTFLDGIGVILTRMAFDQNTNITSMEGNFYRTIGAILVFIVLTRFRPIELKKNFQSIDLKSKAAVIIGSILGTYLSLSLYLKAIQTAHLASLSGLAITGTIFSSLFECLWEKRRPSKYLLVAFIFFFIGMKFLLF